MQELSPGPGRAHLNVYLDQEKGRILVFSQAGKRLADLKVANPIPAILPGIYLANVRGDIRLEWLRIGRWSGELPREVRADQARIHRADGSIEYGNVTRFDAAAKEFLVKAEHGEARIAQDKMTSIFLSAPRKSRPARCGQSLKTAPLEWRSGEGSERVDLDQGTRHHAVARHPHRSPPIARRRPPRPLESTGPIHDFRPPRNRRPEIARSARRRSCRRRRKLPGLAAVREHDRERTRPASPAGSFTRSQDHPRQRSIARSPTPGGELFEMAPVQRVQPAQPVGIGGMVVRFAEALGEKPATTPAAGRSRGHSFCAMAMSSLQPSPGSTKKASGSRPVRPGAHLSHTTRSRPSSWLPNSRVAFGQTHQIQA